MHIHPQIDLKHVTILIPLLFIALSGDQLANIGMGYRLNQGIGVPESCENALPFYEYAANEAIEQMRSRGASANPIYAEKRYLSEIQNSITKGKKDVDPEV